MFMTLTTFFFAIANIFLNLSQVDVVSEFQTELCQKQNRLANDFNEVRIF